MSPLLPFRPACRRRSPVLVLLTALLCPGSIAAAGTAPAAEPATPPFTLGEALRRAEAQHPALAAWRARLRAAEGRAQQARLRPAPELHGELENVFGSGAHSGLERAETTIGFSQAIELGGLRERRIEAMDAERTTLDIDQRIAWLDLRAEVARRFVHVLSDQAQLDITRRATLHAGSTLDEVSRRVEAARSPLAERARAQVSLERARLDEEHAEHELLSSRRHLAAAIGSLDADFGRASGELLRLPDVDDFDTLLERVRDTPDLLRFASQIRLRESELRLAQARAAGTLRLGAGLRHLPEGDDTALVFSATLPLFGATRQRGQVIESQARLAQVGPDREQAFLRSQAQLYEIWQELHHARVEFEAQRDRVVPTMEEALRQTRYAYDRGRYSLLELRDAQTEWAVQQRRLIQSAASYHGYMVEIRRLTGVDPTSTNPRSAP